MMRSLAISFVCLALAPALLAQQVPPVVLDRVVAVVNNRTILASDIDEELRMAVFEPGGENASPLNRALALDQLISRTLIEQQIRKEDAEAVEPSSDEINKRIHELRTQIPACVHADCASDEGWLKFLAAHDLDGREVESAMRHRIQILRFIELRFRQGIRIDPQAIDAYYRENLVPQYKNGEQVPPLESVSTRIEEILLQQQVNILFGDWLNKLRSQGAVEVLDSSLELHPAKKPATGGEQ